MICKKLASWCWKQHINMIIAPGNFSEIMAFHCLISTQTYYESNYNNWPPLIQYLLSQYKLNVTKLLICTYRISIKQWKVLHYINNSTLNRNWHLLCLHSVKISLSVRSIAVARVPCQCFQCSVTNLIRNDTL